MAAPPRLPPPHPPPPIPLLLLLLLCLTPTLTRSQPHPSTDISTAASLASLASSSDNTLAPGLTALNQARSEHPPPSAGPLITIEDEDGRVHKMPFQPAADFARKSGRNVTLHPEQIPSPSPLPSAQLNCTDGICITLKAQLLESIEGSLCRSVFINGKCPSQCAASIAKVVEHDDWLACKATCSNDVVSGAAERWQEMCGVRMETLIDQGKEAVKSLVGEGLSSRFHRRVIMQFFLAVLILVLGVGFGYRRGRGWGVRHKRRMMARKNSDLNMPV